MTDTAAGLVHIFPKNITVSEQVVVLQGKGTLVPVVWVGLLVLF